MIRRRRRRRMIVGAAVVGAAAGRYASPQQPAESQPQAPAAEPAPPAAPAEADLNTQLQQLAQMHSAGVLTDDEFAAAKAKLLGT
jgi:predicted lipid-binding transport protein (Tim44 family)